MTSNIDIKYWYATTVHRYENGVMTDITSVHPSSSKLSDAYIKVVMASDHDTKIRELEEQINQLEVELVMGTRND